MSRWSLYLPSTAPIVALVATEVVVGRYHPTDAAGHPHSHMVEEEATALAVLPMALLIRREEISVADLLEDVDPLVLDGTSGGEVALVAVVDLFHPRITAMGGLQI